MKIKIIILLLILSFLTYWSSDFIKLKYYVWQLGSETVANKEKYASKIVKLGKKSIPKLISLLDKKDILDTDYILKSLEKLTGIKPPKNLDLDKQIEFWKDWWEKNKNKY